MLDEREEIVERELDVVGNNVQITIICITAFCCTALMSSCAVKIHSYPPPDSTVSTPSSPR